MAALTHWGRVTHICVSKLTITGSDNGLSPGRRQAFILANAGVLLIGLLGTNFSEISIEIYTFSFKQMHLEMSSGKWRPFCLGLIVLTNWPLADFFSLFYEHVLRFKFMSASKYSFPCWDMNKNSTFCRRYFKKIFQEKMLVLCCIMVLRVQSKTSHWFK